MILVSKLQGTCTEVSIFKIFVSKLQGTCIRVLIFKIFMCSVLQLEWTIWTLDLKCSQWQKCKYLSWPLFRTSYAYRVLYITFAFMSCHLVFAFIFCFLTLLSLAFPYHYLILKKHTHSHFLIFLLFCSNMTSYIHVLKSYNSY